MIGSCEICEKEIEIQMCCDGYMCGCMGMPIEPPLCDSNVCFVAWEQKQLKDEALSLLCIPFKLHGTNKCEAKPSVVNPMDGEPDYNCDNPKCEGGCQYE